MLGVRFESCCDVLRFASRHDAWHDTYTHTSHTFPTVASAEDDSADFSFIFSNIPSATASGVFPSTSMVM